MYYTKYIFHHLFYIAIEDSIKDEQLDGIYQELYAVFWDRAFLLRNPSKFMAIIDKIENLGGIQYDGYGNNN